MEQNQVWHCDCIEMFKHIEDESIDLVYADPPFNTGKRQTSKRTGISYEDNKFNYIEWCTTWIKEVHRCLKPTGTFYLHLNESMSYKVRCHILDIVFGESNWLSTVIWSYNFGGRAKDRWCNKHDVITVYAKQEGKHCFNVDEIDRIPYKTPELQFVGRSKEAAEARIALGQIPTDVWEMSIVGTNAKERLGYPTQKPVKLLKRIISASSPKDGIVLDPFMGSGTTADAALQLGRKFITCDVSKDAIDCASKRFSEPFLLKSLVGQQQVVEDQSPCHVMTDAVT